MCQKLLEARVNEHQSPWGHTTGSGRAMRPFGFLLNHRCSNLSEPRLAMSAPKQARRTSRRRLDDQIVTLFYRAGRMRDFTAASDLLTVLETWSQRRAARLRRDRRIDGAPLERARRTLEKLKRAGLAKP